MRIAVDFISMFTSLGVSIKPCVCHKTDNDSGGFPIKQLMGVPKADVYLLQINYLRKH